MRKKEIITFLFLYPCIIAILYLLVSFSTWELNPEKWSIDTRIVMSIFIGGIAIFIPLVIIDNRKY